jgi:hypothetical protein
MSFAFTIVALVVVLAIAWRFLGSYMAAVFEGRVKWLAFVERPLYRVIGVEAENEQSWQRYAGLGLTIARTFVEAHGQRIWVEDAPGAGARFCFTLPVAAEIAEEPRLAASSHH